MSDRKIFGRPIREDTTKEFYPDTMTAEEFCAEFSDSLIAFLANMKSLGVDQKQYFVEQWFETYLAWCEVEADKIYE